MSKRIHSDLVRHFLESSPRSQYLKMTALFTLPKSQRLSMQNMLSDDQYVNRFLNRLEVVGTSSALMAAKKYLPGHKLQEMTAEIPKNAVVLSTRLNHQISEETQLHDNIVLLCRNYSPGAPLYLQLENRLRVASISLIRRHKTRLEFLAKYLNNRRSSLDQGQVEIDSIRDLSQVIADTLGKLSRRKNRQLQKDIKAIKQSKNGQDASRKQDLQEKTTEHSNTKLGSAQLVRLAQQYLKSQMQEADFKQLQEIIKNSEEQFVVRQQALLQLCQKQQAKKNVVFLQYLLIQLKTSEPAQLLDCLRGSLQRLGHKTKD